MADKYSMSETGDVGDAPKPDDALRRRDALKKMAKLAGVTPAAVMAVLTTKRAFAFS